MYLLNIKINVENVPLKMLKIFACLYTCTKCTMKIVSTITQQ